jgi:hypothetical protein
MENKRKQIQENIDTTKQNLETESLPGFIEHWTPWDTHRGASSELGDVWCDREQKISQLLAEDDAVQAREGDVYTRTFRVVSLTVRVVGA